MSGAFVRMWGAPIALAILTVIGLISALLGDGVWDHVSAVSLGVPVVLCLWYALRRRPRRSGAGRNP